MRQVQIYISSNIISSKLIMKTLIMQSKMNSQDVIQDAFAVEEAMSLKVFY